jgi:hypothetical protein
MNERSENCKDVGMTGCDMDDDEESCRGSMVTGQTTVRRAIFSPVATYGHSC